MGHDHDHPHTHDHAPDDLPAPLDMSVPDSELAPTQLGRRRFLQHTGLLGGGPGTINGYLWLSGDHHIHTQFSPDAQYRVIDQVQHANAYGLNWMVITDHGTDQHARIGVEVVNPKITDARYRVPNTLGLPGAGVEHPGRRARHRLRAPGAERGQRPQAVRGRLRRRRPGRDRRPQRQHP